METEDEEKLCLNCKRRILAKNHLTHSVHCQRNIVLCPTCDEPVPKPEIEKHSQLHVKAGCPNCKKPLEKCDMEDHKKYDCPKRMIACTFCELECTADDMKEHLEYCGSRTEECSTCGQFILLKEKAIHEQMACSPPRETTGGRSEGDDGTPDVEFVALRNSRSFPGRRGTADGGRGDGMLVEEPYPWHAPLWQAGYSNRMAEEDEYEGDFDDTETVVLPCEFCGNLFPIDNIILHQTGCDLGPQNALDTNESTQPQPVSRSEPSAAVVSIPCEVCGDFFSEKDIDFHQVMCLQTQHAVETAPKRVQSTENVTPTIEIPVVHTHRVVIGQGDRPRTERSPEMLPCEFCEDVFPVEEFSRHQATCDRNSDRAIRSDQLYPVGPAADLVDEVLSTALRTMNSVQHPVGSIDETNGPGETAQPRAPNPVFREYRPTSGWRPPRQQRGSRPK